MVLGGTALVLAATAGGLYYFVYVAPYETTDDAFIGGHVTFVAPRVPGQVLRLLIRDNQEVGAGDLLIELDARDFQARVAQAKADVEAARHRLLEAKAQVDADEAKAGQNEAAVAAAEAGARRAEADLKRYQSVESRAVSRSQLDLAVAQARSTGAELEVARDKVKAAQAQVALSRAAVETAAAQVQQAEARLEQAELDLSYTRITAPVTGRVTHRTVEPGAYVQTGQSLLALVPREVWVTANFKETQLTHMRAGQPVTIRVDAYPGRRYRGKVDSIQAGTGARFSLLPPENAVGNYVKVVQRVPVKIVFDEALPPDLEIAPGLSVVPQVKVR